MFEKWKMDTETEQPEREMPVVRREEEPARNRAAVKQINTILKGSRLTGDINISFDLELTGEVEGNIISETDSSIVIKGLCAGNIETKEGNVEIEGEMQRGNINAGGNVVISGKFLGEEIRAKKRLYINGEVRGRLEGSEIEIGSNALVQGELHYRGSISVAKGARVEGELIRIAKEDAESAGDKTAAESHPQAKHDKHEKQAAAK